MSDEQLENQEHDEDNFEARKEPYQSLASQLYVRFCQSVLRIPSGRPATVTFGPSRELRFREAPCVLLFCRLRRDSGTIGANRRSFLRNSSLRDLMLRGTNG